MRPGRLAAIGKIGFFVDVEAVLRAGLAQVLDVPGDGDRVGVGLLQGHNAGAGLLRLCPITRLAIRPHDARGFQRERGHGFGFAIA